MPTMTAVVMYAPGDVRLETVEKPVPGRGEALLKVAACGVCGSDLDRMFTKGPHKLPLICGHEFSAIVETSGARAVPDASVAMLARHGELVLIGIPNSDITIGDVSWARLMRLEAGILGSWNSFSAPFPGTEWTTTVEKMHSGDLKWEFMITHELGLDSVADTIRQMSERTMHSSKVLFFPDKTES